MSAYWVLMIICFSHSYMFGKWIALQGLSKSNTWLVWGAVFTAEILFGVVGFQLGRGNL